MTGVKGFRVYVWFSLAGATGIRIQGLHNLGLPVVLQKEDHLGIDDSPSKGGDAYDPSTRVRDPSTRVRDPTRRLAMTTDQHNFFRIHLYTQKNLNDIKVVSCHTRTSKNQYTVMRVLFQTPKQIKIANQERQFPMSLRSSSNPLEYLRVQKNFVMSKTNFSLFVPFTHTITFY